MALQIVEDTGSRIWDRAEQVAKDSAADRLERKLTQAEALASIMIDAEAEGFESFSDTTKANVHWLLADLISECRLAAAECRRASR